MTSTEGLIAFFGHNSKDAAVRRRAIAMQRAGFDVVGYMPHRGAPATDIPFDVIDLGETQDNAYAKRVAAIHQGAKIAMAHPEPLKNAGLIVARNLDMLAMAAKVKKRLSLDAPLVYECLDIHHRLTGSSLPARLLRGIEARLLAQCDLVVTSSPRFEAAHFKRYYPNLYRHFLVENRLVSGDAFGPRPTELKMPQDGQLKIGWFGNLRCRRSLELMKGLANAFPTQIEIILRGYPALSVIPDLEGEITDIPNMRYDGRYRAPQDLEAIYSEVDLVWAGDWYETGANSLWLLPNRIYEGGYFSTPALAPSGTETGNWIARNGAGEVLDEPIERSLAALIGALLQNPAPILEWQKALLALPQDTFVEPPTLMQDLYDAARSPLRLAAE